MAINEKIDSNLIENSDTSVDFSKLSRKELLDKSKEMSSSGYSSKTKSQLCEMLSQKQISLLLSNVVTAEKMIPDFPENGRKVISVVEFIEMNRIPNSKCVFACDIDNNCRDTYEENYKMRR